MEADPETDNDSAFGGDRASLASSSTSLRSAVHKYQFENGRRYHAYQAGKYNFPNDDQELNRMDIEHQNQLLQLDSKLHLAPLTDPKEILDLGTGTGIWAIEMADLYPDCEVKGIDLSPTQPSWVPPNCSFEVDDFEQDWTFGHERFDMVHARFLMGSVKDYFRFYASVFASLKPGGWFEISEMETGTFSDDGSVPPDSPSVRWWALLEEAFVKLGQPILKIHQYRPLFEAAGFVDVQDRMLKRPTNDWPKDPTMKEIGRYSCLNFLEGLPGFSMAPFTRVLGWQAEEVEVLMADVRKETMRRKVHGWQKGVVCFGRKPFAGEVIFSPPIASLMSADPASAHTGSADTASANPAGTDSASTNTAGTDAATRSQIDTDASSTRPSNANPVGTEPLSTEPSTTNPSSAAGASS